MWLLRRPRKLLLIFLTGGFIWAVVSFFYPRTNVSREKKQPLDEVIDLSQYDENNDEISKQVALKIFTQNVELIDKSGSNLGKLKLEEAVGREEKKNFIKHEQLNQEIEEEAEALKEKQFEQNEDFAAGKLQNDKQQVQGQQVFSFAAFHGDSSQNKEPESVASLVSVSMYLPSTEGKQLKSKQVLKFGHNESISQTLSLHRPLPDVRDPLCRDIGYPEDLPDASIVIAFYNEAWTTLLRTVHSVLDRSPPHLVKEIILIDDFSEFEHLQQQLKDYLALLPKVLLRRTSSRVGVITARQIGASMATGAVLIFLDSHCECTIGWLEPLLGRVKEDMNHVVTPVMDIIDDRTFEFKSFDAKSINIGGFDWNLQFVWIGIPERVKNMQKSDIDFIKSPTMPGGMFAISRKFFNKLGGFDPGMDMWGAENLEMSFKVWTCGGTLETVPCSHVGHLFRRGTFYKLGTGNPHKNYFRLVEVWLDDYKELYYQKIGRSAEISDDIVERKVLRKQLQCKPFSWYLQNIYPELFIPSDALASGEIRNKEKAFADGSRFAGCLDAASGASRSTVKIWPCHNQGGNQLWLLSKAGEIRRDDWCMDYSGENVVVLPCHGQKGNQEWQYSSDDTIRHSNSKLCMGLSSDGAYLAMSKCSGKSDQIWYWKRKSMQNKILEEENKLLQEIAMDDY